MMMSRYDTMLDIGGQEWRARLRGGWKVEVDLWLNNPSLWRCLVSTCLYGWLPLFAGPRVRFAVTRFLPCTFRITVMNIRTIRRLL